MEHFIINPSNPDQRQINQVVELIRDGAVVVFPTDTIYAVGCSLLNKRGIEAICKLIGKKPERANLSVLCNDLKHISDYTTQFNSATFKLLKRCLPGPFTFILRANNEVPKLFLSNKKTVGIRVPDNKIVKALVETLGHPLVSASVHSEDEIQQFLTEPEEIYDAFMNKVDVIIDGGTGHNEPSTVIDCTGNEPEIIRQGLGIIDN